MVFFFSLLFVSLQSDTKIWAATYRAYSAGKNKKKVFLCFGTRATYRTRAS